MIPIPAIDLKEGKVVRLLQGNFKEEKIYFEKAEVIAKRFEADGAERIHMVDLDGALKGTPKNLGSIEKVLKNVKVPIEVGGGVRDLKTAENYFKMGVRWVILGTKACLDEGFMEEAFKEFGDRIIIGIDALNGLIVTDGWTKVTKIKAVDLAREVEKLGGKTVIYTDISKDGALKGPNLDEIKTMSETLNIDLIASGGIQSIDDLGRMQALKKPNIVGVIIGKALYENKFTLKEAISACSQKE